MTKTLELTVTVEVDIDTWYDDDDDGCGPPSRTGNSMTGRRGKRLVIGGGKLANPGKALKVLEIAADKAAADVDVDVEDDE